MSKLTTSKGNQLPLINLKGKDYLMVAYRLQWLSDDVPRYFIETNIVKTDADSSTVQARVQIIAAEGNQILRQATATKSETKVDFKDHLEKAETAAVGRALAMLGFGTQHALSDLDEGARIVDAPLTPVAAPIVKAKTAVTTKGAVKDF